jgi:hypothetical protein
VAAPLARLALAGSLLVGLAAAGCGRGSGEPYLTYFNGDYGMTLRYPASWTTHQSEQDGILYRTFLGPPAGTQRKSSVSVTLLLGRLEGTIDEFARRMYLGDHEPTASREEERQGAKGRSYTFASADGATRHSLLLLQDSERLYGLFSQAEAAQFERHAGVLEEMARSLTLERAPSYPETRHEKHGFSIRIPPSWRESRSFSRGGTLLLQFTSPALGADRNQQTVHASLTLTVETVPGDGGLEAFYQTTRQKLGESYLILSHEPWEDGYADLMRTETPLGASRVKRFYRASRGQGYSLAFEAREDVYYRVGKWCDLIASTFKLVPVAR